MSSPRSNLGCQASLEGNKSEPNRSGFKYQIHYVNESLMRSLSAVGINAYK